MTTSSSGLKASLRHIAISVPDIEQAAKFYETTFGMKRVNFAWLSPL